MKQHFRAALLIVSFLPLCWLLLQAVHELGHVLGALLTGGAAAEVVLHPLATSRTDIVGSRNLLLAIWAGPIVGCILPLLIWGGGKLARARWTYLAQFFAGVCLIANGLYLGVGAFSKIGDAGDLLQLGAPRWELWMFGLVAVPSGLWLWNGLGPKFGVGNNAERVSAAAACLSCAALAVVVAVEIALSARI